MCRRPFSLAAVPGGRGAVALGLMAKPMLVTLPLVLLLLDYWPLGRFTGTSLHRQCPPCPAIATGGRFRPSVFLASCRREDPSVGDGGRLLRDHRVGPARSHGHPGRLPFGARVANAPVSYVAYLDQFFWPRGLALIYPHPGPHCRCGKRSGRGSSAAVHFRGGFDSWRRRPYLLVGWLWYLGMLVPVIGLTQAGDKRWPTGLPTCRRSGSPSP